MAILPGSSYKARQDMIARMKNAWKGAPDAKTQTRQDHVEPARSRSSKEAREAMIARMTGKPIIKKATGEYREDSADVLDSAFDRIFDRAWDNAARKIHQEH